jgi:SAM-dependent methyltransferase
MRPDYYHLHHTLFKEDNKFWEEMVEGCDSVLELGCGTGRISQLLIEAGINLVGLDLNRIFLDYFQSRISREQKFTSGILRLVQGDMRWIPLTDKIAAVISPCNTISSFSRSDRSRIFNQVRQVLVDQGIFIFSLPNPVLLQDVSDHLSRNPEPEPQPEDWIEDPETGFPVQISSWMESTSDGLRWWWYYDQLDPGGEVSRAQMGTLQFIDGPEIYKDQLREAGFKISREWGGFKGEKYSPKSPYWIVKAVKKTNLS